MTDKSFASKFTKAQAAAEENAAEQLKTARMDTTLARVHLEAVRRRVQARLDGHAALSTAEWKLEQALVRQRQLEAQRDRRREAEGRHVTGGYTAW